MNGMHACTIIVLGRMYVHNACVHFEDVKRTEAIVYMFSFLINETAILQPHAFVYVSVADWFTLAHT